jgi:glycosyltransferase involved in cell wall biosynthesis
VITTKSEIQGGQSLRVALVHSFYGSRQPSGENLQVTAELEALLAVGVDAHLFATHTDEREHEPLYRTRAALRVASGHGTSPLAELRDFGPDVVHVHNLFPNFGRRWVRDIEAPVVVTLHNFRFGCSAGTLFRAGALCTDCSPGRPWPGIRHRCYRGSLAATVPLALAQLGGPAADPLLARADRILCLCRRQQTMLRAGGVAPDRMRDWTNFLPDALVPAPVPSTAPREGALFAGRLDPEKGCLALVEAWPDDIPLHIAGDGAERPAVESAGAGRPIAVLGAVSRRRVVELMATSQALVLPGRWPEGSRAPLVYMEALASGLPMVVLRTSEVADRVRQDGTGATVTGPAEIAAAVVDVASDRAMASRCRRVFEAEFTATAWTGRTLALYRELIANATQRPSLAPDGRR